VQVGRCFQPGDVRGLDGHSFSSAIHVALLSGLMDSAYVRSPFVSTQCTIHDSLARGRHGRYPSWPSTVPSARSRSGASRSRGSSGGWSTEGWSSEGRY